MKGGETMSVRRSGYKAVVDGVGGRRRREDDMVEIRKAKREESLLKKRREALPHSPSADSLDQKVSLAFLTFCIFVAEIWRLMNLADNFWRLITLIHRCMLLVLQVLK